MVHRDADHGPRPRRHHTRVVDDRIFGDGSADSRCFFLRHDVEQSTVGHHRHGHHHIESRLFPNNSINKKI